MTCGSFPKERSAQPSWWLYNEDAIVVEPAGALSIAWPLTISARKSLQNVVCIVSGSNNDIDRMVETKETLAAVRGLPNIYFLITFAQRPGALKEFVTNVLGPSNDDNTRFGIHAEDQ